MRRHDLDLFSLVAGILTVAAAALLGVAAYVDLHIDGRFFWSGALVVLGVVGLVAGAAAIRRSSGAADDSST